MTLSEALAIYSFYPLRGWLIFSFILYAFVSIFLLVFAKPVYRDYPYMFDRLKRFSYKIGGLIVFSLVLFSMSLPIFQADIVSDKACSTLPSKTIRLATITVLQARPCEKTQKILEDILAGRKDASCSVFKRSVEAYLQCDNRYFPEITKDFLREKSLISLTRSMLLPNLSRPPFYKTVAKKEYLFFFFLAFVPFLFAMTRIKIILGHIHPETKEEKRLELEELAFSVFLFVVIFLLPPYIVFNWNQISF